MISYRRANRQYVPMKKEEIWNFLASKSKIFVAFPMKNGFPHISPVWFCLLDGKIYLRTHDYKVKTKLARSGRACCSIDEGEKYRELKGVVVWGKSRVVEEEELISKIEQIMEKKYTKQQWNESQMPRRWVRERKLERRAYVEITPKKISSWDNSKV